MQPATTTKLHDLHGYLASSQRWLQEEYEQIQKRATEDPGTAGDQGEVNWATLLKRWLPSYFRIETKGRILTESGYASPQMDVVVLTPSYPQILLEKKLYLAGGVVAAFECKTTLRASDVKDALETGSTLRRNLRKREGSPYKELNSAIIYGLLAHSHSWKYEKSSPFENINNALWDAEPEFVHHPVECLDFLCVADLGTWTVMKTNYHNASYFTSEDMATRYGPATSGYICHGIGRDRQQAYYSPIGTLLGGLFRKLAWTFLDMRSMEEYFRMVDVHGSGEGRTRQWPISIYSEKVQARLRSEHIPVEGLFDEWAQVFF
ncbi:MAG TPA: DUF6602 domain-containing protein [Candidatus Binatia bacterium]|jgi:hypothetical protein|nr:DUF6602 domain-containing protein [Candidatus Binatia bacterium]